jgi:hypothetical protein
MQQKHWGKALYTVTDSLGSTRPITVSGRERWALDLLIERGALGITSFENPAPRLSAYVHRLIHKHGVKIDHSDERHEGPFAGIHRRYFLGCTVTLGAALGVAQ